MQRNTFWAITAVTILSAILGFQSPNWVVSPVAAQSAGSDQSLGRLELSTEIPPVLIRAELEARAVYTSEMTEFYNLKLPQILLQLEARSDEPDYLISPLQNLALFRDLLADGKTNLRNVDAQDTGKLLAVFLGVAADQSITETDVKAVVLNLSRGLEDPRPVDAYRLAVDAEAVRIAIQKSNN